MGINIAFDFSCGLHLLDEQCILLDKQGITTNQKSVVLCKSCYSELQNGRRPVQSLSNFRWVGPLPKELQDLTWLEEQLIARSHLIGNIVRLSARNASSYFAIKGHTILLPQDTTRLLDILPMSPASLPDIVRVVWAGKPVPKRSQLLRYSPFAGTKYTMLCIGYVVITMTTATSQSTKTDGPVQSRQL